MTESTRENSPVNLMREYLQRESGEAFEKEGGNLDMNIWGRELIREAAATHGWSEDNLRESDNRACLAGLTVALCASSYRIQTIAEMSGHEMDCAIEREAQRLLDLPDGIATALFIPAANPDRHFSLEQALEAYGIWPEDVLKMLDVALAGDMPNWNSLFDEEEESRVWDDLGICNYPSDLILSQGYSLTDEDGISIEDAIESAFEGEEHSYSIDLKCRMSDAGPFQSGTDAYNALYDAELAVGLRFVDRR